MFFDKKRVSLNRVVISAMITVCNIGNIEAFSLRGGLNGFCKEICH